MGVVHRDVKLENVLISRIGGRVQLADFGLSAQVDV
jgi:serine/threonine protein kinase